MIHSHWMAVVVLAVVIILFDNQREKRSVSLTKLNNQGLHVLKILEAPPCTTAHWSKSLLHCILGSGVAAEKSGAFLIPSLVC